MTGRLESVVSAPNHFTWTLSGSRPGLQSFETSTGQSGETAAAEAPAVIAPRGHSRADDSAARIALGPQMNSGRLRAGRRRRVRTTRRTPSTAPHDGLLRVPDLPRWLALDRFKVPLAAARSAAALRTKSARPALGGRHPRHPLGGRRMIESHAERVAEADVPTVKSRVLPNSFPLRRRVEIRGGGVSGA